VEKTELLHAILQVIQKHSRADACDSLVFLYSSAVVYMLYISYMNNSTIMAGKSLKIYSLILASSLKVVSVIAIEESDRCALTRDL
jgi:hypothetical protein